MPPELAEIRRWIEKAEHDLQTAELAMRSRRAITDIASFHCQQAVEKLLKAYLVSKEQDFEKIHDLRALTLACSDCDSAFKELLPRVGPLTAYAVRYRYPGPNDPTVEEVNEAIEVVGDVWAFVLDRLPHEVRPSGGPSHGP